MPTAAQVLGKFAADLAFADIPSAVVERAKDCIIGTVAGDVGEAVAARLYHRLEHMDHELRFSRA